MIQLLDAQDAIVHLTKYNLVLYVHIYAQTDFMVELLIELVKRVQQIVKLV